MWNDLSGELNSRVQRLMNCGVRFVINLRRDVHNSPYRRQLGWLSVRLRRKYFMGCVTYNIVNGNTPLYLLELFNRPAPTLRALRLPVTRVFAMPSFRTSAHRNSFVIAAIYFLHSLSLSVVSAPSIGVLKTQLFEYLFALDFDMT